MKTFTLRKAFKNILLGILVTVIFFVLVEGILYILGFRPLAISEDRYVGFTSISKLYEEKMDSSGHVMMVTAKNKLPWFNPQKFSLKKPAGTFRIFTLGGSTTFGRPFGDSTSFSGWLREILPRADSSRGWEVINTGGVSYASYRIAKLMDELVRYEPDLFIIYSGHNEFLEARTYGDLKKRGALLRDADTFMSKTRVYSGLRLLSRKVISDKIQKRSRTQKLAPEVKTQLDAAFGPNSYHRDDSHRAATLEHYRSSLKRMVRIARDAGVKVIIVTTPGNLKDCSPFKSEHRSGLSGEEKLMAKKYLSEGLEWERENKYEQALNAYIKGTKIDPRHAETAYRAGKACFKMGRYKEAEKFLSRASDEDICPLRALTDIHKIQKEIARQLRVPLVDFKGILKQKSVKELGHYVLGELFFLDHVHFDVSTHGTAALSIFNKLVELDIVHPKESWDEKAFDSVSQRVSGLINRMTQGRALHTLAMVLNWAGKYDDAVRLALRGLEFDTLTREASMSMIYVGTSLEREGNNADAIGHYCRALLTDSTNTQARLLLADALVFYAHLLGRDGHPHRSNRHNSQAYGIRSNTGNLREKLEDILSSLIF